MRSLKIIFISFLLLNSVYLLGQPKNQQQNQIVYHFDYEENNSDSSSTLYCVLNLSDIKNYKKINLLYNDKQIDYRLSKLNKGKINTSDAVIKGNHIYFKIKEKLEEPFVIVNLEDKKGKIYKVKLKDAAGHIIDPEEKRKRWKKYNSRH